MPPPVRLTFAQRNPFASLVEKEIADLLEAQCTHDAELMRILRRADSFSDPELQSAAVKAIVALHTQYLAPALQSFYHSLQSSATAEPFTSLYTALETAIIERLRQDKLNVADYSDTLKMFQAIYLLDHNLVLPLIMEERAAEHKTPFSLVIGPRNFRENHFHLFGQDISIAGMEGPHCNLNPNLTLYLLRNEEQKTVLIGLNDEHVFTEAATAAGIHYIHIPIIDYFDPASPKKPQPIDPAVLDAIYAAVEKATREGHAIAIHCGEGNGRTGVALAALKLRELLEKQAKEAPSDFLDNPHLSIPIDKLGGEKPVVLATPMVAEAVRQIRAPYKITTDPNAGQHSVETTNDVASLMIYEAHVRRELQHKMQASKGLAVHGGAASVSGAIGSSHMENSPIRRASSQPSSDQV